ncbi:hypothetical protein E4U57_005549 [Claviceps arundinis]|uniref:Uncharacterized protein n=1 Tax=Claviceps arundinis TaxID=1623583 RepID=A0A9P7MM89_9HYPO|nr:hypothetical protein E4U57_005549 [Claviceps arundinis]KAG5958539.1 hypothetical protein E4U56_005464 [Claviceps arundinis]
MRSGMVRSSSAIIKSSVVIALRSSTGAAQYSTESSRRAANGECDDELAAKLESEIQVEQEAKSEQQPASIKDFLANSPFELVDTPGEETVKLVREFGKEKITVSFSISELNNFDPYNEDPELEAEEMEESGRGEEDVEGEEDGAANINLNVVIEKPGSKAGALVIDASAQDGAISISNMYYYDDAKTAHIDTPESAHKRADVYAGPAFGSLDVDLQILMERFLEERGVTEAMAAFVPDYVEVKEQEEYVKWLNNVKDFVAA